MQRRSVKRLLAAASIIAIGATGASAATYNIDWTGNEGYTMTGQLIFDDSLVGTGVIDESKIDELAIEVFLLGESQGSRSLSDGLGDTADIFNLNFDTDTGQFVVGGNINTDSGQDWFNEFSGFCDTVGFWSGTHSQVLCVNNEVRGSVLIDTAISESRLTATFVPGVTPIPLPAALPLFLAGLAGLGFVGWRKNRRAAPPSAAVV